MRVQDETISLYIESLLSCPSALREVYHIGRLHPPGIYVFVVPLQVNVHYIMEQTRIALTPGGSRLPIGQS